MKTPRFFLGAVLLFWGRQVDLLWIALILALILESARMVKTRFELSPSDFNKFVDISTVLLAGTVVIALTMEAQKANLVLLRWLPLIFFPIVAAQEFSAKGRMDIKSFFLTARKKVEMRFYETREIDVSYIYAFFCIMSSAFANTKGSLYFFSAGLFFVWGLWQIRSRRVPPVGWVLCILIVMILGYEGQTAVRAAGRAISNRIMSYYARYHMTDPFKTYTALGEIGDLKFSDEIVLRASFDDYMPGKTYLLHNASYNRFSSSNWFAKHGFERILNNGTFWQVNPPVENFQKMVLYFRLNRGKAVLSLPPGVIDISEMKAGECEKNVMQAIRIEDGPSLIKAVVSYTGSSTFDAPPEPDDTFLPLKERPVLKAMAEKLAFENKSEEEILKTVYSFFLSEFTYSLDLKGKGKASTPLENFFLNTKSGHCEFFATATVLLLRQAGIPARYATGFIAHEYSNLEDRLVVRMRDAHAWAKVFINGQWRNIDTTPASFLNFDSDKIPTSLLEDILSFFGFKLSQLRHETGARLMETYGPWLTLPLGLILFIRLRRAGQIKKIRDQSRPGKGKKKKEKPTGFYRIEEILTEKGFPRHPYETYAEWLKRISRHLDGKELTGHLFFILGLHNQWRFGKPEHMEERKRELDERVAVLLTKLSADV
ncbi:MAG: transglutaminase-like domain-containing protein [Desulfobacula sp.]|jgi:transglutaminase-like putative cysteine protease